MDVVGWTGRCRLLSPSCCSGAVEHINRELLLPKGKMIFPPLLDDSVIF